MKNVIEKINEAIVKGKLKQYSNNDKNNNIKTFLKDIPKFKLLMSKTSKKDITNDILNKATYIIYDLYSLFEFISSLDTKDTSKYDYKICWWKDLGPDTYVHFCENAHDIGTLEAYTNNHKFIINSASCRILSEDMQEDYLDLIFELVIIETKKDKT